VTEFSGFPREALGFLRNLSASNSKTWFNTNRDDCESYWVEPAKAFVKAVGEELSAIAPAVEAQPRVNGSIFRINRDVRFSKDKTPYKE
jgi:uncharacterized protein (TIGR02453 family)